MCTSDSEMYRPLPPRWIMYSHQRGSSWCTLIWNVIPLSSASKWHALGREKGQSSNHTPCKSPYGWRNMALRPRIIISKRKRGPPSSTRRPLFYHDFIVFPFFGTRFIDGDSGDWYHRAHPSGFKRSLQENWRIPFLLGGGGGGA